MAVHGSQEMDFFGLAPTYSIFGAVLSGAVVLAISDFWYGKNSRGEGLGYLKIN